MFALGVSVAAACVFAGVESVSGAPSTSIVGAWIGHVTQSSAGHAVRAQFIVVVDRGERAGTWRIWSRCVGTLRLKDVSNGYHHYYRVRGAGSRCAPAGIDCLKRVGAGMVDEFVSNSGTANSTVTFRRIG